MQQTYVYNSLICVLLACSVFFEHAFGVPAVTYAVLMLLFSRKHVVFFVCMSIVVGFIADILYLSPLGTTAAVMNIALYIWYIGKGVSRLRIVMFFGLGMGVTVLLSMLRHTPAHIVMTMIVLSIGWFIEKRMYMHHDAEEEIHIGRMI